MRRYAAVVFLSAFLLFQIQPIVGKVILPKFGGTAAVWTTCLLFFQVVLLAGYVYAHWLVRTFRSQTQLWIHAALLGASVPLLWLGEGVLAWRPAGHWPVISILVMLAGSVGLPYFLLSTTTPLMQAWYARSRAFAIPYRLYALSNVASLGGLLAYPLVFEPLLRTRTQFFAWACLYGGFVVLCGSLALVRKASAEKEDDVVATDGSSPAGTSTLLWIVLPACASALLLGVTNHLTQDVAPIPLLWVLPLAAYLASFILCFDRDAFYQPRLFRPAALVSLAAMMLAWVSIRFGAHLGFAGAAFLGGLFICCIFCHGELARLKPSVTHLTSFYLRIALGGALGGVYVSIVAPQAYRSLYELPVTMIACGFLVIFFLYGGTARYTLAATLAVAALVAVAAVPLPMPGLRALAVDRNFYGLLSVRDIGQGKDAIRQMQHGRILHGEERLAPGMELQPTSYYGRTSGVGVVLGVRERSLWRVGVVGLGCGTLAAYAKPGDYFRFYEINPTVEQFASSRFEFLPKSAGKVDVILGDARLSLEREADQRFDVLVLDAFSGDSVPVHLLTLEAFRLYRRHLRSDGILAVHVSNRFLDLTPVVASSVKPLGWQVRLVKSDADESRKYLTAYWVLAGNANRLPGGDPIELRKGFRPWTDDYSNLLSVLKW